MFKILCKALILALVAAVVLPAIAGEGRTPIYVKGTVITAPGKYIVTRNITPSVCLGPVIDIAVPSAIPSPPGGVDIDLNGMVLFACPGQPVIRAVNQDNITIRNGTLGFADYGIEVRGDPDSGNTKVVIEDVRILNPIIAGIFIDDVTDFALRRNNVVLDDFLGGFVGTSQVGIEIDGPQPPASPVQGTIEANQVERTAGGIIVRRGSAVAILNNRLENIDQTNTGHLGAILYDVSSGGLISENTIQNVRDGNGIALGDTSGCKVYNNVIRTTTGSGIYLAGFSNDNLVLNNVSTDNEFHGLQVDGFRNHIDRNVLNANCTGGVASCWGLYLTPAVGATDNTFGRNTARGNNGNPAACPVAGSPYGPTTDFCDAQAAGNGSFNDNYMPNFF